MSEESAGTMVPVIYTIDWRHLRVGSSYRVAKAFAGYDQVAHDVGDGLLFLGHSYFAREEGLTLYVATEAGAFAAWPLHCTDDDQGPVDAALDEHLVAAPIDLDHLAFAAELARMIGDDANELLRCIALEIVGRMPSVPAPIARAVGKRLAAHVPRKGGRDTMPLLLAAYNVPAEARANASIIERVRDFYAAQGHARERTIAEAVLQRLAREP